MVNLEQSLGFSCCVFRIENKNTMFLAAILGVVCLLVEDVSGIGTTASPPPGAITPAPSTFDTSSVRYDYAKALGLSILFYDAQRAGKLPANNPIEWRGDTFLYEVDDNGNDLTGGWFDAGDHVKFNFPMAYTSWALNWGFLAFPEGYEVSGQTNMMCDMVRWPLEYFLKCWKPDTKTLYTQLGDGDLDHTVWASPETIDMPRPAWQVNTSCPGSEVAGDFASAFASGYLVFSQICGDDVFAAALLSAAESVYAFATEYEGSYSDGCYRDSSAYYGSSNYNDELSAAAGWLHKATGEDKYLDDAKKYFQTGLPWGLDWSSKGSGANLLLYEATQDDQYMTDVNAFINYRMPGGEYPYTPCGFAFVSEWGSARATANIVFVAILAAKLGVNVDEYQAWSLGQINYLLGDNNYHMSYEIGFGDIYPENCHHRGSSCISSEPNCDFDAPGDNPNVLYGALVGGPDADDHWADDRGDYKQNEVAVDYNAGFQGSLAGLVYFANSNTLADAPDPLC